MWNTTSDPSTRLYADGFKKDPIGFVRNTQCLKASVHMTKVDRERETKRTIRVLSEHCDLPSEEPLQKE